MATAGLIDISGSSLNNPTGNVPRPKAGAGADPTYLAARPCLDSA
jgi:hypothetical protein